MFLNTKSRTSGVSVEESSVARKRVWTYERRPRGMSAATRPLHAHRREAMEQKVRGGVYAVYAVYAVAVSSPGPNHPANRSSRSAHPPAQYATCREARTGTSHACRTRTAQLALAAAAVRFRVAAMLPAATQAGMHLGTTHRQAGVPRKRPAGGQEAAAAPPSTKKAEPTPTRS